MTEKRYWAEPLATELETRGALLGEHAGGASVVLDRTLFYPEGGGQLGDTGQLVIADLVVHVADTQIDEAGVIHHIIDATMRDAIAARIATGEPRVRITVDVARRRDHMAQHTAQHALSRALADLAAAETVSARLGATSCTIDVARASVPDADLHRVEDLVNDLVRDDVPVRALYPSPEELDGLGLRKKPTVVEGVRVIEIEGFDRTPCGGTHCVRTGQIGQARFVSAEKYKGGTRLTFHAGRRALEDARVTHRALTALATDLTCGVHDLAAGVSKLRADLKSSRAALEEARAEVCRLVAAETLAKLPAGDGPHVTALSRPKDDAAALRALAKTLTSDPRVVAVCGGVDPASGELVVVVARGERGGLDCGAFVQAQVKARSGRGGGKPDRAEGRFARGTSLEELAAAARDAAGG
jgi:alanyl-tRNA synthetase